MTTSEPAICLETFGGHFDLTMKKVAVPQTLAEFIFGAIIFDLLHNFRWWFQNV